MRSRGLIVALVVSAILNLFLISAGAAAYWRAGHGAAKAPAGLRRGAASLAPADRHAFVAMLRAQGAAVRPANQSARSLRDQAWSHLANGTADTAAVKRDLAAASAINQAARRTVEDATVDFAMTLAPDERHALGEALRPVPSRLPKKS